MEREAANGAGRQAATVAPAPPPVPLPDVVPGGPAVDVDGEARRFLAASREAIRDWHARGAGGVALVERNSEDVDRLVRFLFDAATARYRERYVQLDQRCAVLSQGGYGRREMNPFSDIDLLFLHPHKVTPYVETVTETILYQLWDLRFEVGHAVRSVRECVALAATDSQIKTALIDARPVCGDEQLWLDFEAARERDIKPRGTAKYVREKLDEAERRHQRYGDSVYLLEPQVKEGAGGLRDLHTAMWVAKITFKVESSRELSVKGVLSDAELAEFESARDFLLRVRNSLHFLAGGHQDQLVFDLQETVAEDLGYRSRPGDPMKGVERFLKDYYLHAAGVTRIARSIVERATNPSRPYRLLGRMLARTVRPGVQVIAGQLAVTRSEIVREDPTELVRLFATAQAHDVPFSPRLADLVRTEAGLLDDGVRGDPRIAENFLSILRAPGRVYETLHEMHRLGVLTRVIPEWEHLRCLVLHDQYHIYTVDEHSLRGIRELESLRGGDLAESSPLLTQAMRDVDKVELLFLGMILHDSGKGLGGGHSEKGAVIARDVAGRLGLNEDESRELEFLVRHHLVMSHLSQRRDIHDDKLVVDFARRVGSPEALKRLYLLTYADMRATGPKVWNNWKDMLLAEAYLRVQEVFACGFEPEDRAARIARIRERVPAEVGAARGDDSALECAEFLAAMPDHYLLTTPEAVLPAHAEMIHRLRGGEDPVTSVEHRPQNEFSEFTVVTRDRPGLFATITGVLAASGMNIVAARIATSDDGIVVDAFRVSHLERREIALDDERWQRARDLLDDVLAGKRDLAGILARAEKPGILDRRKARPMAVQVVADNEVSDAHTVLEIYARDRVGLLHRIATALLALGLDIHLALITTNVDQVLDVFYVNEADGRKSSRLDEIRAVVTAALEEPGADEATAPATVPA